MKRLNNVILIVVSCCLLMAFTSISRKLIRLEPIVKLEPKPIEFILDTPALVAPKLINYIISVARFFKPYCV
jgi:hypothetical protein